MSYNNICLFSSYFAGNTLPYYVRVYLKELKRCIGTVVLVCGANDLDKESKLFLNENNISLQLEKNEGFDFGLWYKAFQKIDFTEFDNVFLVNDSCVLFKPLDSFMAWCLKDNADVKGMTLSEAVFPHVQSYFIVLNKKAIVLTSSYFHKHKIKSDIGEVIKTYELGLNNYFTSSGLTLSSFIDNNNYKGEFSPYYYCVEYHLAKGMPIIKKKILFSSYRKDELMNLSRMNFYIDSEKYYGLMSSNERELIIDIERLKAENKPLLGGISLLKYNCVKMLINLLRPLYKFIKK